MRSRWPLHSGNALYENVLGGNREGKFRGSGNHKSTACKTRLPSGAKGREGKQRRTQSFNLCRVFGGRLDPPSTQRIVRNWHRLERTLGQREEIVVPVPIGVGAYARRPAGGPDHSHVGPLAGVGIEHEEGVDLGLDARAPALVSTSNPLTGYRDG